jgi:hypothetical protein
MQTEKVTFYLPVFKDQTSAPNKGKVVEVGDTVVLVLASDGAASTFSATLTSVSNDGRTIGWNRDAASSDYRTEDIARVHAKHVFECQGPVNFALESEIEGPAANLVIDGVTNTFPAPFPATAEGASAMQDYINESILMGNGWCSVSVNTAATPDTLVVSIQGTSFTPNSVSDDGTDVDFEIV